MRGNFITDKHGTNNPNYKDGRKGTRLYRIYNNMLNRCYNANSPQFKNYGGRGITVCREWLCDFKIFSEWALSNGYRDDLTIDRIDVNGNYEPSNCRWITNHEQSYNKRNNHYVTLCGKTMTLTEWCNVYHINVKTVRDRLRRGWDIEKALVIPADTKYRKKVI